MSVGVGHMCDVAELEKLVYYLGNSVLVREVEGTQNPICYVSHVLHGLEESYPLIDKFVLAVVMTARKVKAYFEAQPIKVLADQPVKRVLSNPSMSGEADYRANNEKGSGAGILIKEPKGEVFEYALCFSFKATNSESEYKAIVTGREIASALKIKRLLVQGDSKLVIDQIRGDCGVKNEKLSRYHTKALSLLPGFDYIMFEHIPWGENEHADHLSRLAATYFEDIPEGVHVEVRDNLIHLELYIRPVLEEVEDWRSPIARYLVQGDLPGDKLEVRRVVNRSFKFRILQDELYKQSHMGPLLFCVSKMKDRPNTLRGPRGSRMRSPYRRASVGS
ncbi:hypothetical protein LIER_37834 [Lithospermum erythrorhizon]|uniref:RNase H type-1 domain-containing protein n=1 Tax=Lithospermum erythrorhizon TaxID=34254 RepID=A0AAV3PSZ8_LITER